MKIFRLEGSVSYCGGMAIVAANSKEEACQIASDTIHQFSYDVNYLKAYSEELDSISYLQNSPKVIAHFEFGE